MYVKFFSLDTRDASLPSNNETLDQRDTPSLENVENTISSDDEVVNIINID